MAWPSPRCSCSSGIFPFCFTSCLKWKVETSNSLGSARKDHLGAFSMQLSDIQPVSCALHTCMGLGGRRHCLQLRVNHVRVQTASTRDQLPSFQAPNAHTNATRNRQPNICAT